MRKQKNEHNETRILYIYIYLHMRRVIQLGEDSPKIEEEASNHEMYIYNDKFVFLSEIPLPA